MVVSTILALTVRLLLVSATQSRVLRLSRSSSCWVRAGVDTSVGGHDEDRVAPDRSRNGCSRGLRWRRRLEHTLSGSVSDVLRIFRRLESEFGQGLVEVSAAPPGMSLARLAWIAPLHFASWRLGTTRQRSLHKA